MQRFVRIRLAFCLVFGLPLAGHGQDAGLRVGAIECSGCAQQIIARDIGLFGAPAPQFASFATLPEQVPALIHGDLDVAVLPSPVFVQIARYQATLNVAPESRLVILASTTQGTQHFSLLSKADDPVTAPRSLEGRRLGLAHPAELRYVWDRYAGFHGIDTARVALHPMTADGLLPALRSGEVDTIVIGDTDAQRALAAERGAYTRRPLDPVSGISTVLVARRETVDTRPELLQAYVRALLDAEDWYYTNPAAARALLTDSWGIALAATDLPGTLALSMTEARLHELAEILTWSCTVWPGAGCDQPVRSWLDMRILKAESPQRIQLLSD